MTTGTTRRRLLINLAAASAVAASATAGQTAGLENPDLLKLAEALPRYVETFIAAREDVKRTVAEYTPQWPVPCDDLHWYGARSRPYRTIDDHGITRRGGSNLSYLGTPAGYEAAHRSAMAEVDRIGRTKSKRGMKDALEMAEFYREAIPRARAFWAEIDRLTDLSDIKDKMTQEDAARAALAAHVGAIMEAEARTMTGLLIKAQAMEGWATVGRFWRMANLDANKWADAIAADILHLGGVAA